MQYDYKIFLKFCSHYYKIIIKLIFLSWRFFIHFYTVFQASHDRICINETLFYTTSSHFPILILFLEDICFFVRKSILVARKYCDVSRYVWDISHVSKTSTLYAHVRVYARINKYLYLCRVIYILII